MKLIKLAIIASFSILTGCAGSLFETLETVVEPEQNEHSISIDCSGFLPMEKRRVYFNFINITNDGHIYYHENRKRDNAFRYSSYSFEEMTDIVCHNPDDYNIIEYVKNHNDVVAMIPEKSIFIEF